MDATPSEWQQLRHRWDMATENAGFGVWDLDIRKDRVHCSPTWTAVLGYGDSDVPGTHLDPGAAGCTRTIWRR